jgi:hypothetical protein
MAGHLIMGFLSRHRISHDQLQNQCLAANSDDFARCQLPSRRPSHCQFSAGHTYQLLSRSCPTRHLDVHPITKRAVMGTDDYRDTSRSHNVQRHQHHSNPNYYHQHLPHSTTRSHHRKSSIFIWLWHRDFLLPLRSRFRNRFEPYPSWIGQTVMAGCH